MAKCGTKKMNAGGKVAKPKKMAKGGGCEVRGKTKGTMIKMKKGLNLFNLAKKEKENFRETKLFEFFQLSL